MSILYTFLTKKLGGGDGLVADNLTMKQVSSGLHGTCKQVTDLIWPDLTIFFGQSSEILNFHLIDLKFEQDFHKNYNYVSHGLAAMLDLRENL